MKSWLVAVGVAENAKLTLKNGDLGKSVQVLISPVSPEKAFPYSPKNYELKATDSQSALSILQSYKATRAVGTPSSEEDCQGAFDLPCAKVF